MTHFDEIYEIAADNYGLITTAEATKIGVAKAELKRWVDNGRLEKRGRGVYKLAQYIPTEFDRYAEAVALVGADSFLIREAVLTMHGLALANPSVLTIGTPKRVRRNLPKWVKSIMVTNKQTTSYEGIPSQTVAEAILECKNRILPERLLAALEEAFLKGLVTKADYTRLKKELKKSINLVLARELCERLFAYRRMQEWPAIIVANTGWDELYEAAAEGLDVLELDNAIIWGNKLIKQIATVQNV